ncbi:MAG: hypothetical protein H7A01_06700 [Hahellaceae bacterium]|nr:hypothetical protein [Hahellaceae bacterium]MCP5211798.1 hypothetical protein [Hahellaceae bacterium]
MKYTLSALILTLLLAGCSDDGNKGDPTLRTGQLFFSGIEGLTYQTATLSGAVSEDGTFSYHEGETVSFWLGDLMLTESVPAKEYMTPLEFSVDGRARLEAGDVVNGLSTHTLAEEEVAGYQFQNNLTRFLQVMDGFLSENNIEGRRIFISERSIEQLNTELLTLTPPLDFNVSIEEFEKTVKPPKFIEGECPAGGVDPTIVEEQVTEGKSPVNILLENICFFAETSFRCATPPTQQEIDCAPTMYNEDGGLIEGYDEELIDFYKEDLLDKRKKIIEGRRSTTLKGSDETEQLIGYESTLIYKELGERLFFDHFGETVKEGDHKTRTINIYSEQRDFSITGMEVESENDRIVRIDGFSEESKNFSYSPIGVAGEEATIIINLRVNDDYRWYRKNYRVIIE